MKNRDRQRMNRKKKRQQEEPINYYNHEKYADPTAYQALKNLERKQNTD